MAARAELVELARGSGVAEETVLGWNQHVPARCWFSVVAGLLLIAATVSAIEHPKSATLRQLVPELTLPENVEALKRAGVTGAEIDLVLAHALHWWDDAGPDLKWLPSEKAPSVRAAEGEMLCLRRALWRDRLLGAVSEKDAYEQKRNGLHALRVRLGEILTAEELVTYEFRATPESAKVLEWSHGLGLNDETVLWLAEAEGERRRIQSRKFVHEGRGVTSASDSAAGELARIRTVMLALDGRTAAAYLARADRMFFAWERDLREDLGLAPEVALRLYAWRCDYRLAAAELHENRSVPVSQERAGRQQLREELRAKVEALLGPEPFARYFAHELGRWLSDEWRF